MDKDNKSDVFYTFELDELIGNLASIKDAAAVSIVAQFSMERCNSKYAKYVEKPLEAIELLSN